MSFNKYSQIPKKTYYTSDNNYPIPHSAIYAGTFFNKLAVCYGASNCGKTTIMQQIAYTMRKIIFKFYIISPSEPSNENYTGMTAQSAIIVDISKESMQSFFDSFFETQTEEMAIYKRAFKYDILESLFRMIETPEQRKRIDDDHNMIKKLTKHKNNLRFKNLKPEDEIALEIIDWEITYRNIRLRKRYSRYLTAKMDILQKAKLKNKQKYTMEHLYCYPFSLVYVDDALAEMAGYITKSSDWFVRLFTRVRHVGGSVVIAAHDDTNVLPPLRRNVFVSIYCSAEIVNTNAQRGGNWTKQQIKSLPEYADKIFSINLFAKFVIHREAKYKIRYMIADKMPSKPECVANKLFVAYMNEAYGDEIIIPKKKINNKQKKR